MRGNKAPDAITTYLLFNSVAYYSRVKIYDQAKASEKLKGRLRRAAS
jgi:hypothetical protein